jgi:hypothetical protein
VRQAGNQILGHAIGKVLLIRIVAHVVERPWAPRSRGRSGSGQRPATQGRRQAADVGLSNEPVAAPVQRLDIARLAGIIRRALRELLDAGDERGVTDRCFGPHGSEQLSLGDHLAGVFGKEGQERKGLRRVAAPPALAGG